MCLTKIGWDTFWAIFSQSDQVTLSQTQILSNLSQKMKNSSSENLCNL
jgi:hypothetical protein